MLYLSPGLAVYFCMLAFGFGACMGSFLNCMAWRIVHGESVLRGRSHCDVCGHVLTAGDLVPIVSYLVHRGRCRWCGAKLSTRHVWAEGLTGAAFVLILLRFDLSLQALGALTLACILLAGALADLEGYIIPDRFIVAGVAARIPFFFFENWRRTLPDALLGGFAVGGGLLAFVLLYEKLRRVEAMGGGDLKLLFVTGLWLGWAKNLLCLLLACVLGIAFGLATQKRRAAQENAKVFPWGPSICAAGIVTMLAGDAVIAAYVSMF